MSCQAITFVWEMKGLSPEERLVMLWLANASSGLGAPICPEWIGMGEFTCLGYDRACQVMMGLTDRGLLHQGEAEGEQHYYWIAYGGEYFPPVDWCREPKGRSRRVSALIDRDGPNCAYCDCLPVNYEVDHFIPRAKGGADKMDNLVLACVSCNRSKRDKDPEDFLRHDPRRYEVLRTNLIYLHAEA